jgi:hypothetical protein
MSIQFHYIFWLSNRCKVHLNKVLRNGTGACDFIFTIVRVAMMVSYPYGILVKYCGYLNITNEFRSLPL